MKEALEDIWNITQVNQILDYKEDNLAKSGKVQNSVANFISYYGCVHVGQANLTGDYNMQLIWICPNALTH